MLFLPGIESLKERLQDAERVHVARLDEIGRVHKVRIWSEKCRHRRKVQAIREEGGGEVAEFDLGGFPLSDEVKYGLSRPDDGLTDRMAPPWWSKTRRQELEAYFADYLAKSTCPVTMEVRKSECRPQDLYVWKVRKEGGAFVLGMPGGKGHISLRDEGPEDELSARLAKWAEEETPLMVEITHGP